MFSPPFTLIHADRHSVITEGLCSVLNNLDDFKLKASTKSGTELVTLVDENSPDLVVSDLVLQDKNLPEVFPDLIDLRPSLKVMVFTSFEEPRVFRELTDQGVNAVLFKNKDEPYLGKLIQKVINGHDHFPENIPRG